MNVPQTPVPGALCSLRVFIVENHKDTLVWLSRYLEMMGHQVVQASNLAQAVERFPQQEYDVLISDIGLPDGSGWELLRRVQPIGSLYAIAMSGFGTRADRLESQAVGYRRHLLKPFLPNELDSALEEAAREKTARMQAQAPPEAL